MEASEQDHTFAHVYSREISEEIVERRRNAGFEVPAEKEKAVALTKGSLVGLALSGGGIRSAAFSLGVLQSLLRNRLIRHVDYLSTVSGGGYAGSLLTSLLHHPLGCIAWRSQVGIDDKEGNSDTSQQDSKPKGDEPKGQSPDGGSTDPRFGVPNGAPCDTSLSDYSLVCESAGRESNLVRRLSLSGPVMRPPLRFFSAYFFGLLLSNIVAISGIVALTAMTAYLYRCLDYPAVTHWTDALGFDNDVKRAFFPSFLLLILWLIAMTLGNAVAGLDFVVRLARLFFVLLLITVCLAVVALLGTGDIALGQFYATFGIKPPDTGLTVPSFARFMSIAVVLAALIPYLRLNDLIRSGVRPRDFKDRWIFAIASRALLYGVPLVLFGVFASENISGFNREKEISVGGLEYAQSPRLYPSSFDSWDRFWMAAESVAKPTQNNGSLLRSTNPTDIDATRSRVSHLLWEIANGQKSSNPRDELYTARKKLLESLHLPDRRRSNKAEYLPQGEPDVNVQPVAALHPASPSAPLPLPSEKQSVIDTTVIDNLQEQAGFRHEYEEKGLLGRWLLLFAYCGGEGGDLAQYVGQSSVQRETKETIAERMNYQFLSNPYFAYELLNLGVKGKIPPGEAPASKKPTELSSGGKTEDRSDAVSFETLRTQLMQSAAGPFVQNADSHELRNQFFDWLALKHHLLHWNRNGNDQQARATARKLLEVLSDSGKEASHRHRDLEAIEQGIRKFNHGILQLLYPKSFHADHMVYAAIVLNADQERRLSIFWGAAMLCALSSLVVSLNFTSIQAFYRDALTKIWTVETPGFRDRLPLAQLRNTKEGAPYHLINGSVSLSDHNPLEPSYPRAGFLFSKLFCGNHDDGFRATDKYEQMDLGSAMAVSGAAVTPSAVDNPLVWLIMFLMNLRMGLWLPSPRQPIYWISRRLYSLSRWRPGMAFHVALDLCLPAKMRSLIFVYDGGLYENLGVGPLLARRCRLILAVDASEDGKGTCQDLHRVIQRSRARHGIEIRALENPDRWMGRLMPLNAQQSRMAERSFMIFEIKYPARTRHGLEPHEPASGYLIYLKPTLTKTMQHELKGFAEQEQEFPHDSTLNQFYEFRQFDAYRLLGNDISDEMFQSLFSGLDDHPDKLLSEWWSPAVTTSQQVDASIETTEIAVIEGKDLQGGYVAYRDQTQPATEGPEEPRGPAPGHWIDAIIEKALSQKNPNKNQSELIAYAIGSRLRAKNSELRAVIEKALKDADDSMESKTIHVRNAIAREMSRN